MQNRVSVKLKVKVETEANARRHDDANIWIGVSLHSDRK